MCLVSGQLSLVIAFKPTKGWALGQNNTKNPQPKVDP